MSCWINRFIGTLLVFLMIATPELCFAVSGGENLPDSPGAVAANQVAQSSSEAAAKQEPQTSTPQAPPPSTNAPAPPQGDTSQNGSTNGSQPQNAAQQPVGGAAAQLGRTTGGAASKPAGAALAPTKQRQTRSLVLKLGLLAGAGIAVGSVAALAHGSPSRPPGTH